MLLTTINHFIISDGMVKEVEEIQQNNTQKK